MDCNNGVITFYEGEERYLYADAESLDSNEILVIMSASYTLSTLDGAVVESGSCDIDGSRLTMLLRYEEKGTYLLTVQARIGAETVVRRATVAVR